MSALVTLRDVTPDDLPILYDYQRDPEASAMAAVRSREWDDYLAHWIRILADPMLGKQGILYDGELVGNLVAFDRFGAREVGYWLGKQYWGRGIASQALALFLRQIEERPLVARVATHNIASLRVLQKCGFTIAGEEHEAASDGYPEADLFVLRLEATEPGAEP